MCKCTQLNIFPFAGAQHLSARDFTFPRKRNRIEKGTENELLINEVTAEDYTLLNKIKHFLYIYIIP